MKFLKTAVLLIGGLLPFAVGSAPASASTLFDWTLVGAGLPFTGSGTLTVNNVAISNAGSIGETITAFSGTVNGSAVSLSGPGTAGGNDNILYPPGFGTGGFGSGNGLLDALGFTFTTVAGQTINIWFGGGGIYDEESTTGAFGRGTFSISAETPLPSTWVLMIAGLCGLGFLAFRGPGQRSAGFAAG